MKIRALLSTALLVGSLAAPPAHAVPPDLPSACGALYVGLTHDAMAKATAFRWVLSSTSTDGREFYVALQITTDAGVLTYSGFHCAVRDGRLTALPYRQPGNDNGQGQSGDH